MVTTSSHYANSIYQTNIDTNSHRAVRISYGGYYGTGSLLIDGRTILTSAHLFAGKTGIARVTFENDIGLQTFTASRIVLHPEYDGATNNDLAMLWIQDSAPITVQRCDIYRANDEITQSFSMVGYGQLGTGSSGASVSGTAQPVRIKASNTFDADASTLEDYLGSGLSWTPRSGTQLLADFDNGLATADALGRLIGKNHLGTGITEGFIAQGDSGGPAFINDKLAGVASYTTSLTANGVTPDIDSLLNSSFGEIAAWQRVSYYQQWIDQNLRSAIPNAPSKPDEIKKEIVEGNAGTNYAFFLLEFTGTRTDPSQTLSVEYATRDGTATAGSDYIAIAGRLNLYAGETQAAISVEIIGDMRQEANEFFYLDVTNPQGGSFGEGVVRLTAVRTIIDDDVWIG